MPKTQAGQLQEKVTYLDLLQEGDAHLNATTLSKMRKLQRAPRTAHSPSSDRE
jgi:FMN-dependent NADH-azoreductase